MATSDLISLLASVGACLAAVAAFLTVWEMSKQRKASFRPELALSQTIFSATKDPLIKGQVPALWLRQTNNSNAEANSRSFGIPLSNIGLGAAKNVTLRWSFPIEDLVRSFRQMAVRASIESTVTLKDDTLSIRSEDLGSIISVWKNQQSETIDYLLPATTQGDAIMVTLPNAYIWLTSALLFLVARNKEHWPDLSPLHVVFEYYDIADGKHTAAYDIKLQVVALGGDGEIVHAYLDPKKAA